MVCFGLVKAKQVFDELSDRNIVSWSVIISGYTQHGQGEEALKCFEQMQREGLTPNVIIFTCILKACGITKDIDKGIEIHEKIVGKGWLGKDIMLGNALADMYVKCDELTKAQKVLYELPERDVVSWSILIAGLTQHGQGEETLYSFEQMQREGISPNDVTFLCILNACSHSGRLDDAETYYANMSRKYGIAPQIEHHTCMVVGFAYVGHFEKAISVIKVMPSFDYPPVWIALLSACRKWGNVELGSLVFDQTVQLDDSCIAAYVLMANTFVAAGMQEDAEKVENMRVRNGLGR